MQARYGAGALCRRVMEQARYFSLQPIVQGHKIKTHNFYEIKVDF
jgi:hypothetical protein